jgi:hypothetical protein
MELLVKALSCLSKGRVVEGLKEVMWALTTDAQAGVNGVSNVLSALLVMLSGEGLRLERGMLDWKGAAR